MTWNHSGNKFFGVIFAPEKGKVQNDIAFYRKLCYNKLIYEILRRLDDFHGTERNG